MQVDRQFKQTLLATTVVSALVAIPVALFFALPDNFMDTEAPIGTSGAINYLDAMLAFAGVTVLGVALFAFIPWSLQKLAGRILAKRKQ